jgi:hypothetical protein
MNKESRGHVSWSLKRMFRGHLSRTRLRLTPLIVE